MADFGVKTPGGATENAAGNVANSIPKEREEELNAPYTYKRSITVRSLTNYSAYRNANIAVLGRRRSNIGSSYNSTNALSSNKGELEAYYPSIIGLASNHPDFVSRVKDYLSNIQVPVEESVTFNNSIKFYHKADYLKFKAAEDKINSEFENADKRDVTNLKKAIAAKVEALHQLESEVYKVGKPEKVEDYIIYRHILLYKDVAKDMNVVNYERYFRFILVDESREKVKQEKKMMALKKAMQAFIGLGNNQDKFNAVFVRYCAINHYPLSTYMGKDDVDKNVMLSDFMKEDPIRFNDICNDSNLMVNSFIERLIARGELVRSEHNQQISTADGNFIGKNMTDAIAYFNNPDNKSVKEMYEAKLKLTSY